MDYGLDEQFAASAVAALAQVKRKSDSPDEAAGGDYKRGKTSHEEAPMIMGPAPQEEPAQEEVALQPYPYFYYRDFSMEADPDPLTPLTPPGRVPNFPAKMHSILSRPDLAEIVCWMPHGRSWRVLKPREFEIKVIPTYFEHSKFSSFIRQANGWGFRRITQGRDRNSYYHELFVRGLPHLCKKMKRPGVAEKVAADPDHEPDFYKIAEARPVPEKADDESILLQCTLDGGPKARMPIYSGALKPIPPKLLYQPAAPSMHLTPRDQSSLQAFQQALGASESQFKDMSFSNEPSSPIVLPAPAFASTQAPSINLHMPDNKVSALAAANRLAFGQPSSLAAAQFAAGFAAATALSQQQLRSVLGSFQFVPDHQHHQAPSQNTLSPF